MCSFVIGCALVACGGPSKLEVKTTDAKVESVAMHKTYSHATAENAPSGYAAGEITPDVIERVRREVDTHLQQKGYVLDAGGGGELIVRLSAGTREVANVPSGGAARIGAPVTYDTQRAIVIDILARAANETLFHGYARYDADLSSMDPAKVREAVARTLASVPRAASSR
jgi:hypothetical protein